MRTTSRLIVTAATALTAGLALTACGSGSSPAAAGSGSPVAGGTASASPSTGTTSGSTTGGAGSTTGGTAGSTTGGATGGSGATGATGVSATAKRCTVADVKLTVQGPAGRASEQEPAVASIKLVNTSGHTCSVSGFPGVRLADDQGKSSPIDAVRHPGVQVSPVTLPAGATATAELLYSDVNSEGSASGRLVCGVTGSKVSVILPNTTQQVRVPVSGGVDNGTLNVCGQLTVNPFQGIQD
ncbi:DUF4232 domain-containing protein [Streptacidiphilus anmyonensis]|uniref:DUF4232 domain-containing protein n=1 Tax=Streptacidiphilus anmyonensis TaxID=405782 RepID=UPI0005A9C127|nr:DUF4232 domain-containing protein [Streptacidiphilus anmyonensis]